METIAITANNTDNSSNKYDNNNNNIATKWSFIRTYKSQYFKKLYV